MTVHARMVKYGTAGGVDIMVDHSVRIDPATRKVTLSADYLTSRREPGTPTRTQMTGAEAVRHDTPRTIPSGTTMTLSSGEAAALVAAGKASYV